VTFISVPQYYSKATESQSWIHDHISLVSDKSYGHDEDNTLALLKKHEIIANEIDSYRSVVEHLQKESRDLVDRGHFDSTKISTTQVSIVSIEHNECTCWCLCQSIFNYIVANYKSQARNVQSSNQLKTLSF